MTTYSNWRNFFRPGLARWVWLILAVALLLALFYFVYRPITQITSHEFAGKVANVTDDSIMARGFHTLDADPSKATTTQPQNVTIEFDSNTKIMKRVMYMPIIKNPGSGLNPSPIKTEIEEKIGSITELKVLKDPSIIVTTLNDSSQDSILMASEILYIFSVNLP